MIRVETFHKPDRLLRRRYYFRFRAANGEIMAQSEAYNSRTSRDQSLQVLTSGIYEGGWKRVDL